MKHKWEDRCLRCGQCCYEKLEFEGVIYYTDEPCEHLDIGTNLCRVYKERHHVRDGCVPIDKKIIDAGILPLDCSYVIADITSTHSTEEEEW